MRILSIALIGGLAAGGALLAMPEAKAQWDRYGARPATPGYCYRNPGACGGEYSRYRRYRSYPSARARANRRYGTYYDVYGGRPATLGYCQRNPGRCR